MYECKKKDNSVIEKLGYALRASLQIETVGNQGVNVDETLAVFLSNFLKTNTTETTFAFTNSRLDVASALGECLKYNTSLTTLDVKGGRLVDDGAALVECLKYDTSPITLTSNSNGIGDDGAASLGECLYHNTSLKK